MIGRLKRQVPGEVEAFHNGSHMASDGSPSAARQFRRPQVQFGEDSDFIRVRVRGLPPAADELQFIDRLRIREAQQREPQSVTADPLICGVAFPAAARPGTSVGSAEEATRAPSRGSGSPLVWLGTPPRG